MYIYIFICTYRTLFSGCLFFSGNPGIFFAVRMPPPPRWNCFFVRHCLHQMNLEIFRWFWPEVIQCIDCWWESLMGPWEDKMMMPWFWEVGSSCPQLAFLRVKDIVYRIIVNYIDYRFLGNPPGPRTVGKPNFCHEKFRFRQKNYRFWETFVFRKNLKTNSVRASFETAKRSLVIQGLIA